MKVLAGMEVWMRKIEKWFVTSLSDNLTKYHYTEIAPLTYHYPDRPPPVVEDWIASAAMQEKEAIRLWIIL